MNTQRISAIFEKDLKDFMKNMMLLTLPILPILMAFFYEQMGLSAGGHEAAIHLIYTIVGISFSAITTSMIMTMMAEENEKKTLRGLIQSPASFIDIIVGKSLVTAMVTFITLIISLLIVGIEPILEVRAILGLLLQFLFFLLLGIGIGLFTKSVATTYVYLMPIMFLFGFTPLFTNAGLFEEGSVAIKIVEYFPIMQAMNIHDSSSWLPLGILSIWVIATAVFVYVSFKRTTTDD